ncbi:MAG: ABC transporter ATP-binding protein [Tissierellia bacterium]|nr:ABC transporter ATP-binding protein [Tissierellia bacterium]
MKSFNVKLKNVFYKYPVSEKFALEDITLEFFSGENVVVLGENGMGKSTLFLTTNGVYKPTSGEISIGSHIIKDKNDLTSLRKTVGLVFQDPETQFIAPTVEEEISFGPFNLGMNNEEVRSVVERVLDILDIQKLRKKSLYALSGGEKKLVSIASVLALDPKIIIFDEPTAGLDYSNIKLFKEVLEILKKRGIGLVISTHDINFAWEWAERVIILKDGKVLAEGDTISILSDEKILKESNLEKPDLLKFAELIKTEKDIIPRNFTELENIIKSIRLG